MGTGVSITFDFRLKPEAAEAFIAAGQGIIQATSAFAGFRNIRVVRHQDDRTRVLFIERWDSEDDYKNYIAARTASGDMAGFAEIADSAETNVWPNLIAEGASDAPLNEIDGVSITFELKLKPEMVAPFTSNKELFAAASSFPGFRSIRLVQHKEDQTRILFIERWDSAAAYQAYVDWQIAQGGMEGMRQISTSMQTNIWPILIAHAGE